MGINYELPSWDLFLENIRVLLWMTAHWLLTSGYGPMVLVISLVVLVVLAIASIHGNVKADDSFNIRDDYWR